MTDTAPRTAPRTEPLIGTHQQSDGYQTHYRHWGPASGEDAIVLLHGGISHSGWQQPLAEHVTATSDAAFYALDRRGSGLNAQRGHLPSVERELADIASFLRFLTGSFRRVHLAGWCFGGQIASIAAARLAGEGVVASLVLVAPGYAFTERYADVLRLSMQGIFSALDSLEVKPEPDRAFVPVPLQISDFTDRPEWQEFVAADTLQLDRITTTTVDVWDQLAALSRGGVLSELGDIPVLAVLGNRDRLVDNDRVEAMLTEQIRGTAPVVHRLDTHHAVQFEEPAALARHITDFLATVR
ncbi:alpha/beta fold hydrolase [Actinacidiphila sp. bgisy144]|uniref:alpha/beta fold hydrolase n=1 Tax=Actinacidiphila sp. bgisy144 TaxID=3413791 RepID=UPI003EB80132